MRSASRPIVASLIALLLAFVPTIAAVSAAGASQLGVSPSVALRSTAPGRTVEEILTVVNLSDADFNVVSTLTDLSVATNGGFSSVDAGSGLPSAAAWGVVQPSTFLLPRGHTQTVRIAFKPPVDTTPRGYYAAARFVGSTSQGTSVTSIQAVLLEVKGNGLLRAGRIAGISALSPAIGSNIAVTLRLENTGNVYAVAQGKVTVRDGLSRVRSVVTIDRTPVIPGTARVVHLDVPTPPIPGRVRVSADIGFGPGVPVDSATTTVLALAWWHVIALVVLVALVTRPLMALARRRRRRKDRRERERSETPVASPPVAAHVEDDADLQSSWEPAEQGASVATKAAPAPVAPTPPTTPPPAPLAPAAEPLAPAVSPPAVHRPMWPPAVESDEDEAEDPLWPEPRVIPRAAPEAQTDPERELPPEPEPESEPELVEPELLAPEPEPEPEFAVPEPETRIEPVVVAPVPSEPDPPTPIPDPVAPPPAPVPVAPPPAPVPVAPPPAPVPVAPPPAPVPVVSVAAPAPLDPEGRATAAEHALKLASMVKAGFPNDRPLGPAAASRRIKVAIDTLSSGSGRSAERVDVALGLLASTDASTAMRAVEDAFDSAAAAGRAAAMGSLALALTRMESPRAPEALLRAYAVCARAGAATLRDALRACDPAALKAQRTLLSKLPEDRRAALKLG